MKYRTSDEVFKEIDDKFKKRYSGPFGRFLSWWDVAWFEFKQFNLYDEIKYFIQRGRRGWSDRDIWCYSYFLSKVISEGVAYLRKHGHGYPGEITPEKWDKIQDQIVWSFETYAKALNGDVCFPFPNKRKQERFSKEMKKKGYEYTFLTREEYKKMNDGMLLFIKYFDSLAD